jgi:hypothetical protein
MVSVIRMLNLGPTSDVAKMIEQAMGIIGLFITGVTAGAVLFGLLRALRGRYAYQTGAVLGLLMAVPAILISLFLGKSAVASPIVSALWILIVFVSWSMAMVWSYKRLTAVGPSAMQVSDTGTSVQRVNRRQFMIRLAGYTATITVSGAVVGLLSERHSRMRVESLKTWSATHALPNADAAVKPAPGTRPEFTPWNVTTVSTSTQCRQRSTK